MNKIFPFFIFISFLVGNTIRINQIPGIRISLLDISVFFFLAFSVKGFRSLNKKQALPFLLLCGSFVLSLLSNLNYNTINHTLIAISYLARTVMYYSLFMIFSQKIPVNLAHKVLVYIGLSTALAGFFQFTLFPDLRLLPKNMGWDEHLNRVVGSLMDPGFTGLILGMFLLFLLNIDLKKRLNQVGWVLTFIIFMLTYSRSSYVAFLISTTFFLLIKKRIKHLFLIYSIFLFTFLILPRPPGEGTNLQRVSSIQARIINWTQTMYLLDASDYKGVGFNYLKSAREKLGISNNNDASNNSILGADSSFLFVLVTAGPLGLIAFSYFLYHTFFNSDLIFKSTLIGVMCHSIFLNSLFYPYIILWLALVFSYSRISQKPL